MKEPLAEEKNLQNIADGIAKKYNVPTIKIKTSVLSAKGQAAYTTEKIRGGKINHPKDITIYEWDEIKNYPSEVIKIIAHELAHHIENVKRRSLRHTYRHGNLEDELVDEIHIYLSKATKEIEKSKVTPVKEPWQMTKKNVNILKKTQLIKVIEDTRGAKDRRYKVDQYVVEYTDSENNPYRKSFVTKRGDIPIIPEQGTHEELNLLRKQHQKQVTPAIKFTQKGNAVGKEYHETIYAIDPTTNELMGFISHSYLDDKAHVQMIEVKPKYRRKGIGLALLDELQSRSKKPIAIMGDIVTEEGQALWKKFKEAKEAKPVKSSCPHGHRILCQKHRK